ncbi:YceD family protein [Thauera sp. GDN1]|uniref:YceD family protein n=1 Tax=Thauera sp. GDN1 TaxID=2944810 RepID=UPI002478DEA5|nr:YceD family protein [Thauera sp. GDN1]
MSQQGVPSRVVSDPFRFAAESRSVEGVLVAADLLRLSDALASSDGSVRWRLEGFMVEGAAGSEPRLRLQVEGTLDLRCQRCLGGLEWPLRIDTLLQPVRSGQPIPEDELEDDEVDAIEIDGELDVLALLEDEVLLALPIAPRHQVCEAPKPQGGVSEESPFAALASLRGSHSAK